MGSNWPKNSDFSAANMNRNSKNEHKVQKILIKQNENSGVSLIYIKLMHSVTKICHVFMSRFLLRSSRNFLLLKNFKNNKGKILKNFNEKKDEKTKKKTWKFWKHPFDFAQKNGIFK